MLRQRFFLAGALLLSSPVFAQAAPIPLAVAGDASGYELLVQAGATIKTGPNGGPSALLRVPLAEDLGNERLAVARNAEALALLRKALQKPIIFPLLLSPSEPIGNLGNQARELARQLSQESDVRFADGDFAGAMQSKLDTFDLATRFEHSTLVNALNGNAIASVGRINFMRVASQLDAAQCQSALSRLKAIEAHQATFAEVLKQERRQTGQMLLNSLAAIQKDALTEEGRVRVGLDEEAAAQVATLTPTQVQTDVETLFSPLIENASRAYGRQTPIALAETTNPLLTGVAEMLTQPQVRFRFERSHAQDHLLLAALELRASKLVLWVYPDPNRFSPPTDPFSPDLKPLVYKKTGDSYVLYSVGPDGKDDEGAGSAMYVISPTRVADVEVQFEGFGWPRKPAAPTPVDRLPPDFKGDIGQSPF